MATGDAALLEIVGDIYAAAADFEAWPSVLKSISDHVRADGYCFYLLDLETPTISRMSSNYLTEGTLARYNAEYAADDIWIKRLAQLPTGQMVGSQQLTTRRELLESRLYREYLLRELQVDHCAGGFVSRRNTHIGCLSLQRRTGAREFAAEDISWLNRVAPHVDRACIVQGQLLRNRMLADSAFEALDRLAMAMLLLDAGGRVVANNTLAEQLLSDGMLRCDDDRRLELRGRDNQRNFKCLLRSATAAPDVGNPLPGGAFRAVDPDTGRRDYEVMVWPFAASGYYSDYLRSLVDVVVFVRPRERASPPAVQVLQQLYGLSAAEARVCGGLLDGLTTQEIAEAQGVSGETVRYHCKKILRKTGARRQPELIRTLASGIAAISGFDA